MYFDIIKFIQVRRLKNEFHFNMVLNLQFREFVLIANFLNNTYLDIFANTIKASIPVAAVSKSTF